MKSIFATFEIGSGLGEATFELDEFGASCVAFVDHIRHLSFTFTKDTK